MSYVWKINMIDGKSFYVKTKENNMSKFAQEILPRNGNDTISIFQCEEEIKQEGIRRRFNSVVIVGSKVSSVEYYVE